MKVSVVIPTYNRHEILKTCLRRLREQVFDNSFEVIVVDDGSAPSAESVVKTEFPDVLYLCQKNAGQGAARNLGIKHAKGEIVLLIGDDIFADKNLLAEHVKFHQLHPEENAAVLGFVEWDPESEVTPLMRFMTTGGAVLGRFGGHQFAYDLLEGKEQADHRFFYTANISAKKSLLEKNPFDEAFRSYGFEDIELGYRLEKKEGMKLFYNKNAIGYHHHPMSDDDFARRMRAIGKAAVQTYKQHPELGTMPSAKKLAVFRLISSPLALALFKLFNQNWYFYALSKKYFLEGFDEVK